MRKMIYWIGFGFVLCAMHAQAQSTGEKEDYYSMSLEELLNIPISSASKKVETVFDAPLSSYTITKADIEKSGATSIMEALRLSPGVIVREQANGVYDIHIRGFDNLLQRSEKFTKSNLATLVMIDNRPVFNHNLGGTFWEALPIDLIDVERIEIVRGPSAPLFGPNAVTGVINIITRKMDQPGTRANANLSYGTPGTLLGAASVGRTFGDRFSAQASFNFQDKSRFNDEFYSTAAGTYLPGPDFISSFDQKYPTADQSLQSIGGNVFLNYAPNDRISVDVSAGLQNVETLRVLLGSSGTLMNTSSTESNYVNAAATIHNLSLRTSFLKGTDNLAYESTPGEYDYSIIDANAEYTFQFTPNISIVPGLSIQSVDYNDEKYYAEQGVGFLNGTSQSIQTAAAFLRTDIKVTEPWRVIAALRVDKFSVPDEMYLAYEFASTYKINENNLIRAAVTRSNSGSFIGYNYLNVFIPNGAAPGINAVQRGNQDLNLFTVDMIELGFRTKLTEAMQLDMDVFRQTATNLTTVINKGLVFPDFVTEFDNVPTESTQLGVTLSLNYLPHEKLHFKPFITIQKTETTGLPDNFNDGAPTSDVDHKNTPSVYGGYFFNYKATNKLNLNLNGYFFGSHRQYDDSDPLNSSEAGDIKGKFLVNLKVSYAVAPQLNLYMSGRNILNNTSAEFFGTDQTGGLYMAGLTIGL